MGQPGFGVYGKTVLAEDGLRHVVDEEHNRGFNGWHYWFLCGNDVGWMSRGVLTDDAPTCLHCIDKQRS